MFAELYSATGGIPRKVNQVVTRLLLLGAVEQRSRIDNAMLSAVLAEMQHDNAFPEAAPKPMEKLAPAPAPGPVKHASYPQPAPAPRVDDLLAERDVQIAELQQAVVELSEAVENGGGEVSDEVKQRIETLENRIDEQERMVRHVLTMMIEWMESGQSRAAA